MVPELKKATFSMLTCVLAIFPIYCQNITLKLNEMRQLGQTADSAIVRDVNGEICSMAIIYENLPGIKFYTNLSIENVSSDSSHYTVWFPANASVLKIAVPGFPLLEHPIERRTTPTIYFFILEIPEKQIISSYEASATLPKITITTTPGGARVYLSSSTEDTKREEVIKFYYGRTPVSIDYYAPDQTGMISIYKTGYVPTQFIWDTINPGLSYHHNFKKISHQKQWFLSATTGGMEDFPAFIWGIQAGRLGNLGFYLSGKVSFSKLLSSGYSMAFGLTKSIFKAAHINLGYGYCYSIESETLISEEEYGRSDSSFFDVGFIQRIGPKGNTLLLFQTSLVPGKESAFFDYSAGIGFAF